MNQISQLGFSCLIVEMLQTGTWTAWDEKMGDWSKPTETEELKTESAGLQRPVVGRNWREAGSDYSASVCTFVVFNRIGHIWWVNETKRGEIYGSSYRYKTHGGCEIGQNLLKFQKMGSVRESDCHGEAEKTAGRKIAGLRLN